MDKVAARRPREDELKQLQDAILFAYSFETLKQMVRFELGEDLLNLVPFVNQGLRGMVHDLILDYASRSEGLHQFVLAAHRFNPSNTVLTAAVDELLATEFAPLPAPLQAGSAVDPLADLPPLPLIDLPQSPFRNILRFRREDAAIFFGRGQCIRDLYECVTAPGSAPILLYYGQSGVGKSSLLAAGLLPRLEQVQKVAYTRREQSRDLIGTLAAAIDLPGALEGPLQLRQQWLTTESETERALTVILDQAEEIFSRPNGAQPDEMIEFFDGLDAIFGSPTIRPQGRLVLSFRKEWLAEIKKLLEERRLSFTEVFLQRLDRCSIVEAVLGPTQHERLKCHFQLSIEDGLAEEIADDLLIDSSSAVAPTLQILLDKMWQHAKQGNYDQPVFDRSLYHRLRRQGLLLADFLDQQLAALAIRQPEAVASGLALDLLAFHSTPLQAAEQRTLAELRRAYTTSCSTVVLDELVTDCRDLYLLVDPAENQPGVEQASRLAHDTLAPLVRLRFDESDKPGQRARRVLATRAAEWSVVQDATSGKTTVTEAGGLLDDRDLNLVYEGRSGMRALNPAEGALIEASEAEIARGRRNRQIWQGLGIAAIAAILLASATAFHFWQSAVIEARYNTVSDLVALSLSNLDTNPERALRFAQQAHAEANAPLNRFYIPLTRFIEAESRPSDLAGVEIALHRALQASRLRYRFEYTAELNTLAVNSDGTLIAAGAEDGTTLVWPSGLLDTRPYRIAGGSVPVVAAAFHPTEPILAIAQKDGSITLWSTNTFEPTHRFPQQPDVVHDMTYGDLAYSPNGEYLAIASASGVAAVYTTDTHALVRTIRHPEDDILCGLSFSPDSSLLAMSGGNGLVQLWDVRSDASEPQYSLIHTSNALTCGLAFSPVDNELLATSGQDSTVKLWALEDTSKPLWTSDTPASNVWRVAFSPDGGLLAGAVYDNSARLWDVRSGDEVFHLVGHAGWVNDIILTPNGKHAITVSSDHTVMFWDTLVAHRRQIIRVAFDTTSTRLVTASEDTTAAIWDLDSDQHRALVGHTDQVYQAVFDPDPIKQRVATASFDGTVRLWDTETGLPLSPPLNLGKRLGLCVAMNDGGMIAAGTNDGAALWREQSNNRFELLDENFTQCGWVLAIAFHPLVQHHLATACSDGQVAIWDISTTEPQKIREFWHDAAIYEVVFNQRGSRVVTAGENHRARVWDVNTEQVLFETPEQETRVVGVGLTPDDSLLAVANGGTVKIWNLPPQSDGKTVVGQERLSLSDHRGSVNHLAISPDGRYIATAGEDGIFRLYPLRSSELQESVRQRLMAYQLR